MRSHISVLPPIWKKWFKKIVGNVCLKGFDKSKRTKAIECENVLPRKKNEVRRLQVSKQTQMTPHANGFLQEEKGQCRIWNFIPLDVAPLLSVDKKQANVKYET